MADVTDKDRLAAYTLDALIGTRFNTQSDPKIVAWCEQYIAQARAEGRAELDAERAAHEALKARLALAEAVRLALEDVLGNATCACYEDGEPGHCPRCAVAYKMGADALAAWRAAK